MGEHRRVGLARDQDRPTVSLHDRDRLVATALVQQTERLVEQQHLGVLGEQRRDPHPLALAAGQGPHLAAEQVRLQRVLIARALVQDAEVLLLDEPLSGVDGVSGARIEAVFADLRREGRTLLVATHDVRQAAGWDRVLCLHRRQVDFGPPAAVLSPETLRETYGGELIVLPGGAQAVGVGHHAH